MKSLDKYVEKQTSIDFFRGPYRRTVYYELVKALNDPAPKETTDGRDCLTPCAMPGQDILHPESLKRVTDYGRPFCATTPSPNNDGEIKFTGRCDLPNYEVVNNQFVPIKSNDCKKLLIQHPYIFDWNSALRWAKNDPRPELYRRQILHCASKVYKIVPERKKIYKERQIDYFYQLSLKRMKHWFPNADRNMLERKHVKDIANVYVSQYNLDWLSLHLDHSELLRRVRMFINKKLI